MNNYKPPRPAKQLPDGTFEIPLTRGYVTIVDVEDIDLATFKWFAMPARAQFRAFRKDAKSTIYLHRVILSRMLGRELLPGEVVDHKNGNSLDNRRSNLRPATHSQNLYNQRRSKNNTSGFKGVSWSKAASRWQAHIRANGKNKYLGYFDTPQLAYIAYCTAALEYFGEFANDGEQSLDTNE